MLENEVMVWVLGLVVSAFVYVVNYWQRKKGKKVSKTYIAVALYLVAFVAVLVFGSFAMPVFPVIPIFPDTPVVFMGVVLEFAGIVLVYAGEWLTLLTLIVGMAVAPYEFLYKRVMEAIKPLPTKV